MSERQFARLQFSAEDSGGFVANDTVQIIILNSLPNQLPVAIAGEPVSVSGRETVFLQGRGEDADGHITAYRWRALAPDEGLKINNADSADASFIAPNVAETRHLTLVLAVTDNEGGVDEDELDITVSPGVNTAPAILSAKAGPELVYDSETVSLSAVADDADGDPLHYRWRQADNGAPAIGIAAADTANAHIVVPAVADTTVFEFVLTVDDGRSDAQQSVSVMAVPRDDWNPSAQECLEEPLRKGCPLYPLAPLFNPEYYSSCVDAPLSQSCLLGDLLGEDLSGCLMGLSPDDCVDALLGLTDPSYLLEQIGPDEPADSCNPAFDVASFEHYGGAMHEHTAYSDGTFLTRPADVYKRVKSLGFDFAASSDHSDTLQIPLSVGRGECPPDKFFYCYLLSDDDRPQDALAKWSATLEQSQQESIDGQFTALRGFEWTSDRFGHANVFFSRNFINAKTGPGYAVSMALFWEWFTLPAQLGGGADGLLSFNHPGREDAIEAVLQELGAGDPAFTFNDFRYVASADYRVVGLEVFGKGSEYDSGGPNGSWLSYALDKGWHLAPIGSEDHHDTRWGDGDLPKTVLIARSVATDDLREALLARRSYAVAQDYNALRLEYFVDGHPMGSRLRLPAGSLVPVSVTVNLNRSAEGPVRIELVGPGNTVLLESQGTQLSGQLEIGTDTAYSFVRVYDNNRPVAFAAPVWLLPGDTPLPACHPPEAWSGDSVLYPALPF